jgi:hypothetical protein
MNPNQNFDELFGQDNPLKETVFIMDLSKLPKKPPQDVIHRFVREKLRLDFRYVKALQINYTKKMVYVETTSPEIAYRTVENHNKKHVFTCDYKDYVVKLKMADPGVYVKLYDLSLNMPYSTVRSEMGQYGEVISVTKDNWGQDTICPNVNSGVFTVHIKLRKPIPSYITIGGEETYCSYANQVGTCRHCALPEHEGISCDEAAPKPKPQVERIVLLEHWRPVKKPDVVMFKITPPTIGPKTKQIQHTIEVNSKPLKPVLSAPQVEVADK